jgi:hypothetical protein
MNAPLLAELSEDAATGRIAEIYDEIRRFSGVSYVSSLQRFLATLPGVLEWAWDALRPAMVSGAIPTTGWRLAESVRLSPMQHRPPAVDQATRTAVRNIAANFVRVSPVNLVTGACLAGLLGDTRPSGQAFPDAWTPPAMLQPMPGIVDPATLSPDRRAVLMRFATEVDGKPFIPALYRQLAHFPHVLAWLAGELVPRLTAHETAEARTAFRTSARNGAPAIVARLPNLQEASPPDDAIISRVLATIGRYAETSPEMTLFGQLILEAFPDAS